MLCDGVSAQRLAQDGVVMDWLTFTSKLIESLVWPIVVLTLGLVFRKKLLDLIPAIRKLKAGPVEAEFELATKQVLANLSEVTQSERVDSLEQPEDKGKQLVSRLFKARSDPVGMILDGWAKVDGELFAIGQQMGLLVDPLTSTAKVYDSVMASDILPLETRRLIREVRELRNQVAHAQVDPTPESAQDYVLAVDRVVELVHNYRKNLPNYGSTNR